MTLLGQTASHFIGADFESIVIMTREINSVIMITKLFFIGSGVKDTQTAVIAFVYRPIVLLDQKAPIGGVAYDTIYSGFLHLPGASIFDSAAVPACVAIFFFPVLILP